MTVYLPDRYLKLSSSGPDREDISKLVKAVTGSEEPVTSNQLKGGITNQLALVDQGGLRLLVRSFGKGTDTFIDRSREFAVHQSLQVLGLAPKLYGQFGNGLIYGYVPGRPTTAAELSDEYIMTQVSRRLAQWHATLKPKDVEQRLEGRRLGTFWDVLGHWVELCPEGVLPFTKAELERDFQQLKSSISQLGGSEVMGHCDLLSANILVPETKVTEHSSVANPMVPPEAGRHYVIQSAANGDVVSELEKSDMPLVPYGTNPANFEALRSEATFIDYEYAIPCPRAFDIANHFQEWQGYECEKGRVPRPDTSSEKLKFWCDNYLHAFELITEVPQQLDCLVNELKAWWGMPGFYWGVWSAIQSKSSDIDFGYHDYASNRFQEYIDWKSTWG